MLRVADRRAAQAHRPVDLRRADATALPFPSRCFDTVVCTFSLCCVPDQRSALTEAIRVLRPHGELLLADHVAASFWPLRALQHLVEVVSVPLQGEYYTRRPLTLLRSLGVDVVTSERLTLGMIERVHARAPR